MKITFNTGRLYTKAGQIITAEWDADREQIHFNDHSRMITGTVEAPSWDTFFTTPGGLAAYLMARYDRLEYQMTPECLELRRDDAATVHLFRI
jgi:hypothetical protein